MATKKRHKSLKRLGAATAFVSLSALGALGAMPQKAEAITATMNIFVELVNALEITINTSMDFGTLAMTGERAGQATIDPQADKLLINGSSSLTLAGGVPTAGRIRVKGVNAPVTVSMEDTAVQLTNGTTAVTVSNFNFASNEGGAQITVQPSVVGNTASIAVGATVKTKQGQLTGSYIGSNRIFANYH